MAYRSPNFFILGAPKCGTSSMNHWLSEHPNVFMSKVKEPNFYNTDHGGLSLYNQKSYKKLFKNVCNDHKIIGESSAWYLYSKVAVTNILNDSDLKELKFLVMIRNPIKMSYSLHEQQVFSLNEPEKDFLKAWDLQRERSLNKKTGFFTKEGQHLRYGDICKLGVQIERLYKIVPKEKIKIIVLDDIYKNPLKVYKETLSFLKLPYDGRSNFKALNTAKVKKSRLFALFIRALGDIKYQLKIQKGLGLLNKINRLNLKSLERKKLDRLTENKLKQYFKEDVLLLSRLIDRDLSHWCK